MKNQTDYLYYRELYSSRYYGKKYYILVLLENKETRYLYFDEDKHIRLTTNLKNASMFSRPPRNYDKYKEYIQRKYKGAKVTLVDYVVIKSKY